MSSRGQSIHPQTRHALSLLPDSLFGGREGAVVGNDLESHELLFDTVLHEVLTAFSVTWASGNETVDSFRSKGFEGISAKLRRRLSFDIPPGERSADSKFRKVIGGRSLRSERDGRELLLSDSPSCESGEVALSTTVF